MNYLKHLRKTLKSKKPRQWNTYLKFIGLINFKRLLVSKHYNAQIHSD